MSPAMKTIILYIVLNNILLTRAFSTNELCAQRTNILYRSVGPSTALSSSSIVYEDTQVCSSMGISIQNYVPKCLLNELEFEYMRAKCQYLDLINNYPNDIGPLLDKYTSDQLTWDIVICGSAPAVLSALYPLLQLGKRILVLEKGHLAPIESNSLYHRPSLFNTEYVIPYNIKEPGCEKPKVLHTGNALGGCSIIDMNTFVVPARSMYDKWAKICPKWRWENVNSVYREIEYHEEYEETKMTKEMNVTTCRRDGRITITKTCKETYTSLKITKAFKEVGYGSYFYDSETIKPGLYILPSLSRNGDNVLLTQQLLGNASEDKDLELALQTEVVSIKFNKNRAVGVNVVTPTGKTIYIKATDNIIIGTNPISAFKLLTQSGVGNPDDLKTCGIKPIIPLPALGKHFAINPIYLGFMLRFPCGSIVQEMGSDLESLKYLLGMKEMTKAASLSFYNAFLQVAGSDEVNVQVKFYVFSKNMSSRLRSYISGIFQFDEVIQEYLTEQIQRYDLLIFGIQQRNTRSRGHIKINPDDVSGPPLIEFDMFSDPYDDRVMIEAAEKLMEISRTRVFQKMNAELVALPLKKCGNKFDRNYIRCSLTYLSIPSLHPYGGSVMGIHRDTAVVNENLQLFGIENLYLLGNGVIPVSMGSDSIASSILIGRFGARIIQELNGYVLPSTKTYIEKSSLARSDSETRIVEHLNA